jgi:hypothetical protein
MYKTQKEREQKRYANLILNVSRVLKYMSETFLEKRTSYILLRTNDHNFSYKLTTQLITRR